MVIPKGGLPSPMMSPVASFYRSKSGTVSGSVDANSTCSTVKTGRSSRRQRKQSQQQQQQQQQHHHHRHQRRGSTPHNNGSSSSIRQQHSMIPPDSPHSHHHSVASSSSHHHHHRHRDRDRGRDREQRDIRDEQRDSSPSSRTVPLSPPDRIPTSTTQSPQHAGHQPRHHSDKYIQEEDNEANDWSDLNDEALIRKLITEGLWSHNIGKLEIVLNKIGNLMFTSDEAVKTKRRDAIYRSGGHLAIVQAMKKYPRAKGVQTQGCRALANATWEASDFMDAITSVGGVGVILSAMVEFPDDEVVQICGSCALRNLTSLKKIAKQVLEEDGFPVAVSAMKNFPMNANIQECGCWTVAHVCLDVDNKPYIQSTRCFAIIGAAADNHPKQLEVQRAARRASERMWAVLLSG